MESPNRTGSPGPSSSTSPSQENHEITPVQMKMANLSTRSSFASFFCKTKRPVASAKMDPIQKVEGSQEQSFEQNLAVDKSFEADSVDKNISNDTSKTTEDEVEVYIDNTESDLSKQDVSKAVQADVTFVSDAATSSSSSDSDIQIISSNVKMDDDVISISSDDSSGPVLKLSDYSNLKKVVDFTPLPTATRPDNSMKRCIFVDQSISSRNPSTQTPAVTAKPIPTTVRPTSYTTTTNTTTKILNNTKSTSITATKTSTISSFLENNFNDLDPGLREELMTRMSQKSAASGESKNANVNNESTSTIPPSNQNDSVITFKVIQRLNPGTFDETRSPTGKLLPCTNFIVYWKSLETFGALKQKIAATLKASPFDLVLVNAQDHLELFDTTRPSSLNMTGLNLQEYAKMQQVMINEGSSKTTPKTPAAKKSKTNSTVTAQQTSAYLSAMQNLRSVPPVIIYLYTKSSFAHFKTLQQTKRRQIYDSLSFLQTAEGEISKLNQLQPDDAFTDSQSTVLPLDDSLTLACPVITLNVKTAANRNQSYSIKLPVSSKVSDILSIFTSQYNVAGTRVIFDGEVLKNDCSIDGLLEDDDMIEIK